MEGRLKKKIDKKDLQQNGKMSPRKLIAIKYSTAKGKPTVKKGK